MTVTLSPGLNLVTAEPSSTPLAQLKQTVDFAPLVPMQALNTLQQSNGREQLAKARTILLGGGFVDPALEAALQPCNTAVFASYGMTETLSHIALRRLNGENASDWYTPFDSVNIRLSEEGTLIIHAPNVCAEELTTNDIAEIDKEGNFRILGRKDNTINSGGVKIQIEQVEELLKTKLHIPFQITATPDKKFGEIVTLLYNKVENGLSTGDN